MKLGALRPGVTLPWVITAAAIAGLLAVVWPESARPLVSVLAGVVLLAATVETGTAIARRVPRPAEPSPFTTRRERSNEVLPTELLSMLNNVRGLRNDKRVPETTFWLLRRIAAERLAIRHGHAVDGHVVDGATVLDGDTDWLLPIVSPTLFAVLTDDEAGRALRGGALPALLTEVENL